MAPIVDYEEAVFAIIFFKESHKLERKRIMRSIARNLPFLRIETINITEDTSKFGHCSQLSDTDTSHSSALLNGR